MKKQNKKQSIKSDLPEYPFKIRRLTKAEGGGYLITYPDLPGCMSDGETIEEAVINGKDAVYSWIMTAREFNDPVPAPNSFDAYSGKWVMRAPKTLHRDLAQRAQDEGVSLNQLALTFLSKGLAGR